MFTVDYKITEYFFDRLAVQRAVDDAEGRALSRAGAFIRQRARTDILRRRKKTAGAGQPPSVHSKHAVVTLRNILFAFVPASHSVIIGPVGLNSRPRNSTASTVPELLEFGGQASVWQWQPLNSNQWIWGRGPRKANVRRRSVRSQYAAHPFMGPALEKEVAAGTINALWAGAVRRR